MDHAILHGKPFGIPLIIQYDSFLYRLKRGQNAKNESNVIAITNSESNVISNSESNVIAHGTIYEVIIVATIVIIA
jgi:hypothetical protein